MRGWKLAFSTACLLGLVVAGCGDSADCPDGEQEICSSSDGCRCGPPCPDQGECSGNLTCSEYLLDDDHDIRGVCTPRGWGDGSNNQQGCGGCPSGQFCVDIDGAPTCRTECQTDADCPHCCADTTDPTLRYCPQDTSLCPDDEPQDQCRWRTDCLSTRQEYSEGCRQQTSVVHATNNCSYEVVTEVCHEDNDGTWSCGSDLIPPGETSTFNDCLTSNPTGRYWVIGLHGGDYQECEFPEPGSG